eukprot:4151194-Pleurochrysis_carterae.AAC.2
MIHSRQSDDSTRPMHAFSEAQPSSSTQAQTPPALRRTTSATTGALCPSEMIGLDQLALSPAGQRRLPSCTLGASFLLV